MCSVKSSVDTITAMSSSLFWLLYTLVNTQKAFFYTLCQESVGA